MVLVPSLLMAQAAGGIISRPDKKNQMPEVKRSPINKQNSTHVEDPVYEVLFDCNVPSADLYIDGKLEGSVKGTRKLKSGYHRIDIKANDFEDYFELIDVESTKTLVFEMKKAEPQIEKILRNIIANMIRIGGGKFYMGATTGQGHEAQDDEKPDHIVELHSFQIGKFEVTQEEWRIVMGNNPSCFHGDHRPVEGISWNDCQLFIRKLNELTGKKFRLPTEAEWEYAARGGWAFDSNDDLKYAGSNNVDEVAWTERNSDNRTHDVGTKRPNKFGIYDMSGNISEWCQDLYGNYLPFNQTDPTGESSGYLRVVRGGAFNSKVGDVRVSKRDRMSSDSKFQSVGFRLAL